MDKRSLQVEQAKFLRIRVEIPIDKPLRRGGNITNAEGDRVWINFKYERLPTFCYIFGILGHDDKHCHMSQSDGLKEKQYGDWLKAGGVPKSGSEKGNATGGRNLDPMESDVTRSKSKGIVENLSSSIQIGEDEDGCRNSNQKLVVVNALKSKIQMRNSNFSKRDSLY